MTNNHENRTQALGRREFLKKGLIWGGAGTAAVALGSSAGAVATCAQADLTTPAIEEVN